jgi:RND family efflux transporter MFP subunit
MNRYWLFPLSVLTLACSPQRETLAAAGAPPKAPAVQIETVAVSSIPEIYRASGTVRARQVAAIAARIASTILDVRVHAGDRVAAGETLVVLDHRDLEANLGRAEAARAEAESALAETENAIGSARASVELARATHRRLEELLGKRSVSQQEFEESQARLRNAEAAVEMAVSRRRQVEARRSQADAEIAAARIALGYATLAAPFAGLVTERKADPGSLATPGAVLLTIEREGSLRLEAAMDESRLNLVRQGEVVPVEIDGVKRTFAGRVAEIVPSVDPATRTFVAKIDLPDSAGLRGGMFGRASFRAGERSAVLAPESAVVERGQIRSVHVVEGETARLRLVTVGETRGNLREILSGLSAGEKIVVAPSPLLTDGARVAILEAVK